MLQQPNFSEKLRKAISDGSQTMQMPRNQVVVSEGEQLNFLPILKSGLIRVFKEDVDQDRELLLYYVSPGETCMMSFVAGLKDRKSMVSAKIEEDSELLLIPMDKVRHWRTEFEEWNQWILDVFLERYSEVMDTIREITFNNIEERLTRHLQKVARQKSLHTLETTHLELAQTLGTTRVVISRILKKLEHDGLVALGRGWIRLNSGN